MKSSDRVTNISNEDPFKKVMGKNEDTETYIEELEKEIERLQAVLVTSESFNMAMKDWERRKGPFWTMPRGKECVPGLSVHERAVEIVKVEYVLAMWYAYEEGKIIELIENAMNVAIADALT